MTPRKENPMKTCRVVLLWYLMLRKRKLLFQMLSSLEITYHSLYSLFTWKDIHQEDSVNETKKKSVFGVDFALTRFAIFIVALP